VTGPAQVLPPAPDHRPSSTRLPVSEAKAQVILAQPQRVRARFPGTPLAELKLLPTDRRNPHSRQASTAFTFGFAHRAWVSKVPLPHQRP
jgi:hypothetical protein